MGVGVGARREGSEPFGFIAAQLGVGSGRGGGLPPPAGPCSGPAGL